MIKAVVVTAVLVAGIACAPLAHADPCTTQACLSQPFSSAGGLFVGDWGAHKEHVTVNSDGSGTENSSYGTRGFKMTYVQSVGQPTTAYGNVPGGGYVTMVLVDGGNGMLFSMANGDNNFPFCKMVNGSYVNSADCGA